MATDKEKAAQGGVIMTMSLVFFTHLQGLRKAVSSREASGRACRQTATITFKESIEK